MTRPEYHALLRPTMSLWQLAFFTVLGCAIAGPYIAFLSFFIF